MKRFRNPAIVFGGGATTGLGAIRSLGRAGVDVYYIDEKKNEAIYSKYCRKYFILPKTSHNKDELRNVLLKLQDSINDAVLFPASDSYALNLSDLMDDLSDYYLPAPKKEVIEILINKRRFYQSLMKEKIPHPTTHFPETLEDIKKIGEQMSYPIFIKPSISHLFAQRFRKKGFVANSETELLRYWAFTKKLGVDVMIQEIIPGPQTSHVFLDGYIDRNSNPKVLFARRRLRMWPLSFGNSSICVSIPVSEIAPFKKRLLGYLKSINYQGIFSGEFKKDQRDGVFKLLEINSRTSAWFNTLSAKCGINIMLIAYLDAIGRDIKYSEDYEAGIKWVFLRDDLRSAIRMMLNGDLTLREWLSSLSGKKDYESYAKDDLRPFIMSLPHTIFGMI
jgi:D-aspartate ligase